MAQNKERQIAAQSQLKMVQEWATSCGYCLSLADLVKVSTLMVEYVENGYSKEMGDRLEKVDSYINSNYIPKDNSIK